MSKHEYGSRWVSTVVSVAATIALLAGCNNATQAPTTPENGAKQPSEQEKGQNPVAEKPGMPQIPMVEAASKKIDLAKMPDTTTILTVDGVPITIGEFKRQLLIRDEQVRSTLSIHPSAVQALLEDARKNNITLTDEEKAKLLSTAQKAENAMGEVLKKQLARTHTSTDQFNTQVLAIGLAMKEANRRISQELLQQLVDREIIVDAAKHNGFSSAAFNKYAQIKRTPAFEYLLKTGHLTAEQMKDEVVKNELTLMQMAKIQQRAPLTDADVANYYKAHQDQFKHGERVRLSQILVLAPSEDNPPVISLRTQIKKAEPSLTGAQLDAKVKATEEELRKRAEGLLKRARGGETFADLANQFTDDIPARAAKTGGDMGFQDRTKLNKAFADKVWSLNINEVYPQVIPTPLGFHIVKVVDKEKAGTIPLAEAKKALKAILIQTNQVEAFTNWLQQHRKEAQISLSPQFQALVSSADAKPLGAD